jgi:hypothetical protein
VIVAVPAVRVVQVTTDDVVGVIAVPDRLVPASGAVRVVLRVRPAVVRRRAGVGVLPADVERVLVDVVSVDVVHAPVVEVVLVASVLDRLVTAARAVLVRVILVNFVLAHVVLLSLSRTSSWTP